MLEIHEKFDNTGYEELKEKADNLHITEAMEQGRATGYIAYAYETDRTVVYGYDDNGDIMLCDGLVRSVMFKSVLKGIETMVFDIPDRKQLDNLKKLHFLSGDSNVCENLDGFMNACSSCKSKKED